MVLKFHYIKNKNNIFQSCEVNEKYKFISFYLHNPIDCKNFLKFTKKALEENLKKEKEINDILYSLFPPRGGLTEMYVADNDREKMNKINDELKELKKKLANYELI